MCEKNVQKRRKKSNVKTACADELVPGSSSHNHNSSNSAEDSGDDGDSDGGAGSGLRPERVRRWDHLRKIHRIVVCSACDMHMLKPLLQAHKAGCARRR